MADGAKDSHLSQKGSTQADEKSNVPQRHRNRLGEKVNGTSNPNGPGGPDMKKTVSNNQGKSY